MDVNDTANPDTDPAGCSHPFGGIDSDRIPMPEHAGHRDCAQDRLQGMRNAMAERGLNPDDLAVVECLFGINNGAASFEIRMERENRPTAVLYSNDVLTVGALRRAREMGRCS